MYSKELEELIDAALADGVLTEKEKQILLKKAKAQGIDLDEFEMVLDARAANIQKTIRPTKEKRGNVITCPRCGAVVPAYIGKCPECGFEFENVEANLSSQKLAALLQKATTNTQKKEIIETFPLPNTKSDLLEFLTALKPRILDVKDPFANSYYKKYQECIEKAKISFSDDALVRGYIDEFEKINKSINRTRKKQSISVFIQNHKLITAIIVIFLIVIAVISGFAYRFDDSACKRLVMKSINVGNFSKAEHYLYSYKYGKFYIDDAYAALVEAYLQEDNIEKAKQVANQYTVDLDKENVYKPLYEYLMVHKKYDDAEKYIPPVESWGSPTDAEYYNYLSRSIVGMCKEGKYDDAKIFIISKYNHFRVEGNTYHQYRRKDVFNELNAIISNYIERMRPSIEDPIIIVEEDSLEQEVNEDSMAIPDELPMIKID